MAKNNILIGLFVCIGIMALAAKGVIDIVKEQSEKEKKKVPKQIYEPREYTPRIESEDIIGRGLDKMLRR